MANMQRYVEELDADFDFVEIESVMESHKEIEIRLEMPNGDWGLPSELYRYFDARNLEIVDFSHVSNDGITLYISRE